MNLISKKDLLAITGISYGQLYRWKRERLIPDEWFIKQSAYTGQETFFPREQILSRIQSILDLKDQYSHEELAKILSPGSSSIKITLEDLREMDEIDGELLDILPEIYNREDFEFMDVIFINAISQVAKRIGLDSKQCAELIGRSASAVKKQKSTNVICTVINTDKEYHTVFSPNSVLITFDDDIEVIEQLSLSETADKIKIKYKNKFVL